MKPSNAVRLFPVCLAILICLTLPGRGHAQTSPVPANSAPVPANPASAREYLLGPEDVLTISVLNFPELSAPQVAVLPNGTISVALLDPVPVAGKTPAEVKQLLTEKWKRYVIDPSVNVAVTQQRSESVHMLGYVEHIGKVEYKADRHLLEALSEAGGAAPTGDLSQVTLIHKSGAKQVLDLSHPETKAGSEVDVLLQPGDLIFVPERRIQFNVVGQVARPGSYDYKDDMRVLDALTLVGGVLETSDLNAATLLHDGKDQKLDLEALLRRGDLTVNIKMSPGDRIVVPELRNRTYVFGDVGRPGYYLFKPGDRILDALNGVGGPMRDAEMKKINRIRTDKVSNKPVLTTVNMDLFFKKADLSANLLLEPGDVIYVPNSKRPFGVQDVLGAFSGVQALSAISHLFGL